MCYNDSIMDFGSPPLITKKGMAEKIEQPQKTFFFERLDGNIFCVGEEAAWNIYSGKSQTVGWRVAPPKLIGTSDGKIAQQAIIEARAIFEKEGLAAAQEHIREGQRLEQEEAIKHPEPPRNFDRVDNYGRPTRMEELR